jgi:hypothetical protein
MGKNRYHIEVQGKEEKYYFSVLAFSISSAIPEAKKIIEKHGNKEDIILLVNLAR